MSLPSWGFCISQPSHGLKSNSSFLERDPPYLSISREIFVFWSTWPIWQTPTYVMTCKKYIMKITWCKLFHVSSCVLSSKGKQQHVGLLCISKKNCIGVFARKHYICTQTRIDRVLCIPIIVCCTDFIPPVGNMYILEEVLGLFFVFQGVKQICLTTTKFHIFCFFSDSIQFY